MFCDSEHQNAPTAQTVMEAVAEREDEERGNAMKALENRTLDSKQEMDIMDALEELQALNGRHGKVRTLATRFRISRGGDRASLDHLVTAQLGACS